MSRNWRHTILGLLVFILLHLLIPASAQQKSIPAVKITESVRIDGILDDEAWKQAPVATSFIQNYPAAGSPATTRTEVRILYDNSAVYIGAYLYDDPDNIRRQLTSRDGEQQTDADYFSVLFDTYNDHQNGFQFLVTSRNVQTDARLSPSVAAGFGGYGDRTWDAVWESKTSIVEDGWIAELRIPYISLRFAKRDVQTWGLQFLRFARRTNETSFWNFVDPKVNGFVNQFGEFTDLKQINPPLRLSFSPYVTGGLRDIPRAGGDQYEWLRNGGMDVKYGVSESFTLDATLIPDFGQVISDNVINNLSPFEVRFQENRPFFSEGTELFNKAGLFYSRRVGATPSGFDAVNAMVESNPNLEIIKNPSVTQLYNATKFSGRTKKKLGIGIFNAVTAPMYATVRDKTTRQRTTIQTEPLTNYNILVLDQSLKGRSYLTLTNTNVIRYGSAADANVSALDFSFYDSKNIFNVKGTGRYSKRFTTDPYDGFNTYLQAGKVSGKIQYNAKASVTSPRYNPRDLGFILFPNEVSYSGRVSYNQFTPTRNFLSYSYSLDTRYALLYNPYAYSDWQFLATGFWIMKNFWDVTFSLGSYGDQHDYFVLGLPADGVPQQFVNRPSYGFAILSGSTDSRRRLFFRYEYLRALFYNVPGKNYYDSQLGLRYRFSNKLSLDLDYTNEAETDYIIYAGEETNGDPIISFVDFNDITTILSGTLNFTPRINLTLRARHYWSHVIHNNYANVGSNGEAINMRSANGRVDNYNIFNLDAFFTWDFRLGSRLILGYKNWLPEDQGIDGRMHRHYLGNIGRSFGQRHGNEITLKFIYFLDYNQLRKKS